MGLIFRAGTPPYRWRRILLILLGTAIVALYLFPIYWIVANSLKTDFEVFRVPPTLFPKRLVFTAYARQFSTSEGPNLLKLFSNSLLIATSTAFFSMTMAIPAGYSLARLKIRGKKPITLIFLLTQMLPASLVLTPLFIIFRRTNLYGTFLAVIIADSTICIPFAVIIGRAFFHSIPRSLEEAAKIDGCGPFSTLVRVILPISYPGIVVAAAIAFVFSWADLVYALTFLNKANMRPMTTAIYYFQSQRGLRWNEIMAYGTLAILPVLLLFVFLQKHLIEGLTTGSIKG